jgi:hypothetical protein
MRKEVLKIPAPCSPGIIFGELPAFPKTSNNRHVKDGEGYYLFPLDKGVGQ